MKGLPDLNMGGFGVVLVNILPTILLSIIIALLLVFIIKLTKHRILVEKLNIVNNGYVVSTMRYAKRFDRDTKMYYLSPMFGREKLPIFPPSCFQKNIGVPFIGVQRQISLIFKNNFSPVVALPNGEVEERDIKRWYFMEERAKYIKQLKRGDLMYFLALFAPSVVIIGALLFWAITIYMQAGIIETFGDKLNTLTDSLIKWAEHN